MSPPSSAPAAPTCRLLVIAKQPIAGRVKTRLTPPYSPAEAAALATASIADTLAAVLAAVPRARALGHVIEPVLILDGESGEWLDELMEGPHSIRTLPQRAGGLDVRLAGAFEDAANGSDSKRALLIGMDTPQVTPAMLVDAVDALTSSGCDAVLGLADDGGWWALGVQEPAAHLLLGVPMSTPDTGEAQRSRIEAAGLHLRLLPSLRDVDTAADADQVAAEVPRSRFATTLAALRPAGELRE